MVLMVDCWMARRRSKDGDLVPDTKRFPSGIKKLVDKIHSMGMKFGIYESAGYFTCQGYPGSLGTSSRH
jgi:alpha-galactosidase